MTSAWPVASACHSAQCSSWSKAQNKQLDEQLDLLPASTRVFVADWRARRRSPPRVATSTSGTKTRRREGVRGQSSSSIEGEDDSVADAESSA